MLAVAGAQSLQAIWLNPALSTWAVEALWPALSAGLGIYFAHNAEWELRDSGGRIRTRGNVESGDTGSSNPTWVEQNASHTEIKILRELDPDKVQPGDIITIRGELPPCRGTCSPAMEAFAKDHDVTIYYSVGEDVWVFRPSGQVTKP
jgi:hypothetical protein